MGARLILGIGTDLCKISRVQRSLERFGARFAERILVGPELQRFFTHSKGAAYLAKRFAAKEAFSKAMGTGMRNPVLWSNLMVSNDVAGRPQIECLGALSSLVQERGVTAIHLSLTDEDDLASAFVVLEKA